MRLTTQIPTRCSALIVTVAVTVAATGLAACVGEVGDSRKPGRDATPTQSDRPCTKIEKDVAIRSAADMTALPKTGCYDIYGKLTLQGQAITSLAGLNEINSVDELDLDHTAITAIDTRRPLGIFGKLTVTGNARLTDLKQLSFEIASTGILIDGNTALTSLDPLGLDDPKLGEVSGDIVITGNPALTRIPLGNLTKLTGALTVSNNAQLATIDLARLATAGHVEIADNPRLAALPAFPATTIHGDLAVRNNTALTSLGAMSSLYRVTGSVTIDGNPALANLAGFTGIKLIDQSLTITRNQALTDLGALKHLQLVGAITITGNPSLVTCRAIEVDRCTQHPTTAIISNNKDTSCNWQCQ